MKKIKGVLVILSVLIIAALCLVICKCASVRLNYGDIEEKDQLIGKWYSDKGQEAEFPLISGGQAYFRIAEKETDDTEKWSSFADANNLTADDLWSRRFAMTSKIYDENYPVVSAGGIQTGLKLRRDASGKIFSRHTRLVPDSNIDAILYELKEIEILVSKDGTSLLIDGDVYHK